jgi:hypothetical protein
MSELRWLTTLYSNKYRGLMKRFEEAIAGAEGATEAPNPKVAKTPGSRKRKAKDEDNEDTSAVETPTKKPRGRPRKVKEESATEVKVEGHKAAAVGDDKGVKDGANGIVNENGTAHDDAAEPTEV